MSERSEFCTMWIAYYLSSGFLLYLERLAERSRKEIVAGTAPDQAGRGRGELQNGLHAVFLGNQTAFLIKGFGTFIAGPYI